MTEVRSGCACGGMLLVLDRAHAAMRVDLAMFSIEATLRAAYKLSDRCYILLGHEEGAVTAFIIAKTQNTDVAEALGAFGNELIDQQLREQLERQFAPMRALIAAQAFAEGNLLDPEREDADGNLDPRNIGAAR